MKSVSVFLGFCSLLVLTAAGGTGEALTVKADGKGGFAVFAGERKVVESISVERSVTQTDDVQTSFATCADGTKVWNRWSEVPDRRFRLEIGERTDGAVEITMSAQVDALQPSCERYLDVVVPVALLNSKTSIPQNLNTSKPSTTNWFETAAATFDFNPYGMWKTTGRLPPPKGKSHVDVIGSFAYLLPQADGSLKLRMGSLVNVVEGGFVGMKMVIRPAGVSYDDCHQLKKLHYADSFAPKHLLAFASPKRGAVYSEGDVDYDASRGYGWLNTPTPQNIKTPKPQHPKTSKPQNLKTSIVGYKEGAYYSALSGEGEATYRFGGLIDGWYVLTFVAGNYAGAPNDFSITLTSSNLTTPKTQYLNTPTPQNPNTSTPQNLKTFSSLRIAKGDLRRIVRPVHVTGGQLDVNFSGKWLVSVLALQAFLTDQEDFMLNRGYWLTKGYEPGFIYQSADFPGPVVPGVSDTTDRLPVPGQECRGTPKPLVRETELPPSDHPGVAWTKAANMSRLQHVPSTFGSILDPKVRSELIRRQCIDRGATAVLLSGLQDRHQWARQSEAIVPLIGDIADELHGKGIKLIDHVDTTLLFNTGVGARLFVESPGDLLVSRETGLVAFQRCSANPAIKEKTYPYFRKLVAAGVDGLQVDENYMWRHGCLCHSCCERFRRETGWEIPLNECSEAWTDIYTPFFRELRDWRNVVCTDYLIGLRRHVKDLNDHLVLSAYPTFGGFISESCNLIGQDMGELMRVINFFGLEIMSRSFMRNIRCELPDQHVMKTHGELHDAPLWIWYYNFDWQTDYSAWAVSMLAGSIPLVSNVGCPAGTPDYISFGKTLVPQLAGSTPLAEIGVYFSTRTREARDGTENWKERVFPAMEMMDELHIPYAVVPDFNVSDARIKDYKVMYLCGKDVLTPEEQAIFARFERRGGRLVRGQESDREFDFNYRTVGQTFTYDPDPVREEAFRARLRRDLAGATWWTVDAPKQVFSSVRRLKDGTVVIQFFNQTGVKNKVGEVWPRTAPDPAYPPLEKDLVFTLPKKSKLGVQVEERTGKLHSSTSNFDFRLIASSPDFAGERELTSTVNADGSRTVRLPKELLTAYVLIKIQQKGI